MPGRFYKYCGAVFWALALTLAAWGHVLIRDNNGYVITWMPGTIPVQVKLPTAPVLGDGTSQSGSVVAAIQAWNQQLGVVQFAPQELGPAGYELGNDLNEVVIDSTIEGESFGANTLAVAVSFRVSNERVETDIIFNSAYTWDSYRGSLQGTQDIRRVALHELGHMLGLNHPDDAGQMVTAVMNSAVSNVDALQSDDIEGGRTLYGAPGFVPPNNNLVQATVINLSSGSIQVTGTNVGATAEMGEPAHAGEPARRSVWWRWTAPSSGSMTITTLGSNFDTVLAVYTGGVFTEVTANDDVDPGVIRTSTVTFNATADTTYHIAVDGWDGYFGQITLNLNFGGDVPPLFTTHPSSQTRVEGVQTVFSGSASGSPAPTYQWQRLPAGGGDWQDLTADGVYTGVTSNLLTIQSTTLAMLGDQFRLVATNSAGSATSNPATLTVNGSPPLIFAGPQAQEAAAGGNATLSVAAGGSAPLSYQWRKNSVDIPGATGSSLVLNNLTAADTGQYQVVVSNPYGSLSTGSALLRVVSPPTITQPPVERTVSQGETVTLSVSIADTGGTNTYQWTKDGANLGQPSANLSGVSYYSIANAQPAHTGVYRVIISNVAGSVTSEPVAVTVLPVPPPTAQFAPPLTHVLSVGGSATLSVGQPGSDLVWGTPLSYQWYKDGQPIPGATSNNLMVTVDSPAAYGEYFGTVTNPVGTGVGATMTVVPGRQWDPPARNWRDARSFDGVAYFLFADTPRIARYDLATTTWLESWALPQAPAAFTFAPDAIYVAYGGQVMKYDRSLAQGIALITLPGTVTGLLVRDGQLVIISDAYPYTYYRSVDRGTGSVLGEKTIIYGPTVGVSYSESHQRLFACTTSATPSDIWFLEYHADGSFGEADDSPYHGAFVGGRKTWAVAGGELVVEDSGVVYRASDLRHRGSVGGYFDDLLLTGDGGYHILRNGRVSHHDANLQETASASFPRLATFLARHGEQLLGFTQPATAGALPTVDAMSLATLQPPSSPVALDPAGRQIWSPAVLMDEHGVVYLHDKVAGQVFRWSAVERGWLESLPIMGSPNHVALSAAHHSLYFGRMGHQIRRLPLWNSAADLPFHSSASMLVGVQAVGRQVMFAEHNSQTVVGESGDLLDWKGRNSWSRLYEWEPVSRRLYFFQDNLSPNNLIYEVIDAAGKMVFSGSASGHGLVQVQAPIRMAPGNDAVILGSGQIFYGQNLTLAATLPVTVLDAAWEGEHLHTMHRTTGGTELRSWNRDTRVQLRSTVLSGEPVRLFVIPGNQLLCITSVNGVPAFNILNPNTLAPIAPTEGPMAPEIVVHPQAVSGMAGETAVLRVAARGTAPLAYQWRKNGQPITGATGSTLVIPSLSGADVDSYVVDVSNAQGTVQSAAATVSLLALPVITTQPQSQMVSAGSAATFVVTVADSTDVSYQWFRNGTPISGATHPSLTLPSVQSINVGAYTVQVTNPAGTTLSAPAILAIGVAPSIVTQPQGQTLLRGQPWQLSVSAIGAAPLSYQWWKNGEPLDGATGPILTFADFQVEDAGNYHVVVSNAHGSVLSNTATLSMVESRATILAAASANNTVFLKEDGTLWAAGFNTYGQLGTGGPRPVHEMFDDHVVQVATGMHHFVWLKADGTVWTMGYNQGGQLGDGTQINRTAPIQVADGAAAVAAGSNHSLILKTDGSLWGMGDNGHGTLGDGTSTRRLTPVPITTDVVTVAAVAENTFFIKADGSLWGMGSNDYGQLGDGTRNISRLSPVQIATGVQSVSAGEHHTVFVKTDGTLWGMGLNSSGQLRSAVPLNQRTLSPVQLAASVKSAAAGYYHTVYLGPDGQAWGLGSNLYGELGQPLAQAQFTNPVLLAADVNSVAAGYLFTLLIKNNGDLWGMGTDSLRLGLGINRTISPAELINSGEADAPPAPATLSATVTAAGGVRLNWGLVLGAAGYEIWRNNVNDPATATRRGVVAPSGIGADPAPLAGVNYYWVRAVNAAGVGGWSPVASVSYSPPPPPQIILQPADVTVPVGEVAQFSVQASGSNLLYQWQRRPAGSGAWVNLSEALPMTYVGTTTPVLNLYLHATQPGNQGDQFRVVVSNSVGSVTSQAGSLWVSISVPAIVSVPEAAVAEMGAGATFSVGAVGQGELSYQWYRDGIALTDDGRYTGSRTATLTISASGFVDQGQYHVVVTGQAGLVSSAPVRLEVRLGRRELPGQRGVGLMRGSGAVDWVDMGRVLQYWDVVGSGDFNGDGRPDLLWQDRVEGDIYVWFLQGTGVTGGTYVQTTLTKEWTAAAVADFTGDGLAEILVENRTTGERGIWVLEGYDAGRLIDLGLVGQEWTMAAAADLIANGTPDIVWQNVRTGERYVWYMQGTSLAGGAYLETRGREWEIVAAADFDRDGWPDLWWQNGLTGDRQIWLMAGLSRNGTVELGTQDASWGMDTVADFNADGELDVVWTKRGVKPVADFNRDGRPDTVWQHTGTGERRLRLMNPAEYGAWVDLPALETDWMIGAVGDFDGDGYADLVWEHRITGERYLQMMPSGQPGVRVDLPTLDPAWRFAGSADFNGDGYADILLRHTGTGQARYWYMEGATVQAEEAMAIVIPSVWEIAAMADFDGDGQTDILWRHTGTGEGYYWFMNGPDYREGRYMELVIAPVWRIVQAGDFNDDGHAHILWRHAGTGESYLWIMRGTRYLRGVELGVTDPAWILLGQ
ncbi:MAG: immunoglobulin domain-containing protein [Opitutaceae bacterium]|nr:immunoglobulin domain-containing protein [Opitutaceae bacterium]